MDMDTYQISHRTADQTDADGFSLGGGLLGEQVATVEAANPAAARRAAEALLRTMGISWRGYTDAEGCTCAWLSSVGLLALSAVAS